MRILAAAALARFGATAIDAASVTRRRTFRLDITMFVFNTALSAITNRDIVTDFSHVDDTFRLENTGVFTKLTALGTLNPAFFRVGAAALDANDFIVYNQ